MMKQFFILLTIIYTKRKRKNVYFSLCTGYQLVFFLSFCFEYILEFSGGESVGENEIVDVFSRQEALLQ